MNALRKLVIATLLVGALGALASCSSGTATGLTPLGNCCEGCRAGTGCTCNQQP